MDDVAHRRKLSNVMPLLFKNGKLVVNDIDQLVFSDDPNSCRCCPGLCECPSGSDYSVPKYLDDINFAVTGFPASYTETSNETFREIGTRFFATTLIVKTLTLNGWDAINGTYPGTLLSSADGVTECTPPDPVPECPYDDTRSSCYWKINYPRAFITGTYSVYYLRVGNETGQDYRIETTDNYYAYGVLSLGSSYFSGGGSPGATVQGCFSSSPYGGGDLYAIWNMEFVDRVSLSDAIIYQYSHFKTDCGPVFPSQYVTPDQAVKPIQLTTVPNLTGGTGVCPGSLDYNPTRLDFGEYNWTLCNNPTSNLQNCNFSFSDCISSGSIGGPVFGVPFLNRFYDYQFESSAFSFQYQWNPTILP